MQTRLAAIAHWFDQEKVFLLLLLAVTFVTYGLLLPQLGFYWDDWETVNLARQNTLRAYWDYFQYDRPMMTWTQIILVTLLGQNPLKWHIFALLMRWLNATIFYSLLKRLWPSQLWTLRLAALLLVVYPGFTQQALAATYGRYFLISTCLFVSFFLTLKAIHEPGWRTLYTAGAIFLGILQAVSLEYFVGLELLRPLFIYFSLESPTRNFRQTLKLALRRWAPYSSIPLAFLFYRLFLAYFLFPNGDPHPLVFLNHLAAAPVPALIDFSLSLVKNSTFITLSVWLRQLMPADTMLSNRGIVLSWLGGFTASAAAVTLTWYIGRHPRSAAQTQQLPIIRMGITAVASILIGLTPLLLLGREPMAGKWADRFTLPVMYGCTLLLACGITWLVNGRRRQALVTGALLSLAIAGHIQNTAAYADDWKNLKDYLWQLTWRAPQIESGTTVIGPDMPLEYMAPYSIGFAIDQIYGSGADLSRPEYWWLEIETFDLNLLNSSANTVFALRNIRFPAAVNQSVLTVFQPGICMLVIDDFYTGAALLNDDAGTVNAMLPYASTQAILASSTERSLPEEIFGAEPPPGWCTYYQKADLARQFGDWERVIQLYQDAYAQGFKPKNSAERLPLVEAYLQTGNWAAAYDETAAAAQKRTWFNDDAFCRTWQTLPERANNPDLTSEPGYTLQLNALFQVLNCDP